MPPNPQRGNSGVFTADTRLTLIIAVTYTVEMGGGEKWEKSAGKADILHNGVITTALVMRGCSGCYYNSALCNIALGSFWCECWKQLFTFLLYLFFTNSTFKQNK